MSRPKIDYREKVFRLVTDEWLTTNQIKSKGSKSKNSPKTWITYYNTLELLKKESKVTKLEMSNQQLCLWRKRFVIGERK